MSATPIAFAQAPSSSETALPTVYPGDGPKGRVIAFILQTIAAAPKEQELRAVIDDKLPLIFGETTDFVTNDDPTLIAEATQIIDRSRESFPIAEGGDPLLFRVFNIPVLVVPVARALPRDEFAADWQDRRQFANASEVLSTHQAHTIIFALGDPRTTAEQVRSAEAVSAVAMAYSSSQNTLGIHWGEADLAVPPAAFIDAFEKASTEASIAETAGNPIKPPWHRLLTLWINIRPVTANLFRDAYGDKVSEEIAADIGDDAVGFVTNGLVSFIGREVELVPSGRPATEQALVLVNLLAYLLDQGQVFKDNDTLGLSEERTIAARIVEQGALASTVDKPVLRLNYLVDAVAAESSQAQ